MIPLPPGHHQIPSARCIRRLTPAMPIQQQSPNTIGLPPVLTNVTIFVFRPMAAIAMMIKNLLSSLSGPVTAAGRRNTVLWRRGSIFAGRFHEIYQALQSTEKHVVAAKTVDGSSGQSQNGPDSLTKRAERDMV